MRPPQENDVFHAIAHPARRAILVGLKHGEQPSSARGGCHTRILPVDR